jgi:site-specific DNA recombinase
VNGPIGEKRKGMGLIRTSSYNQKDNQSLQAQEDAIRARAFVEGFEIIKIIVEETVSAFKNTVDKRKGMQELLETALEDFEIEGIFFLEESRTTRQFEDFTLLVYREIKEKRPEVKFFSVNKMGEWDPYKIDALINNLNASHISLKRSQESIDLQRNFLKRGKRPGSELPFGYIKNKVTGNEEIELFESKIVLFIFFLASWGYSQQKVANILSDFKVPSPGNKPKWSSKTIEYILNNSQYLGHLPWNVGSRTNTSRKKKVGEYDLIVNHHTPIIPITLWTLAHQTIEMQKQLGGNNVTPFILRGLIHCKNCNQVLKTKDATPSKAKRKYLFYYCPVCKNKVDMNNFNKLIIEELKQKLKMRKSSSKIEIRAMLSKMIKNLQHVFSQLKDELKVIEYKENIQSLQSTKDEEWKLILNTAKVKLEKNIREFSSALEHVTALLEDPKMDAIIEQLSDLDVTNFSSIELRTLCLIYFKEILIDFINGCHVTIDSEGIPFVSLGTLLENTHA